MKVLHVAVFALSLVVLSACGGGGPVPKDQFYRLSVTAPSDVRGAPYIDGLLVVDRPLTDGVTVERAIAYSDTPNQLTQYAYHYWIDTPPRLVQQALVEYLRDSKIATAVVTPDHRALADYTLQGRITRFEHDRGATNSAVIAAEFSLLRERDGKVLFLQAYEVRKEATDASVPAAVDAMSAAMTDLCGQVAHDLAKF